MLFRLEIKAQKRTAIRTSCPMQIRDFICFIAFLNWTRWQYRIPKRENRTAEAGGSQLSHNIFFTLPAEFGLCHFIPYFYLFSSVLSKTILQAAAEEQRVQEMQAHSSAHAFNPRVLFDWCPWAGMTHLLHFPPCRSNKRKWKRNVTRSAKFRPWVWRDLKHIEGSRVRNTPKCTRNIGIWNGFVCTTALLAHWPKVFVVNSKHTYSSSKEDLGPFAMPKEVEGENAGALESDLSLGTLFKVQGKVAFGYWWRIWHWCHDCLWICAETEGVFILLPGKTLQSMHRNLQQKGPGSCVAMVLRCQQVGSTEEVDWRHRKSRRQVAYFGQQQWYELQCSFG